jgi:hypothetical protein
MDNELPTEPEPAVTAQDLASQLKTPTSVVYRMAKLGLIPCLRTGMTGRGIRFIPSEVRAALKNRSAWIDPVPQARGKQTVNS